MKKIKWSPSLAYAVGLLVTDGSLSSDGRHIAFTSTDYYLVDVLKKIVATRSEIHEMKAKSANRAKAFRIQIGNVQLYRWLQQVGLTPNKTHTVGLLKIPKKFFRDFLRGHLDGDGSIYFYYDSYNTYKGKQYHYIRLYTKFISASEQHIRWLHAMLEVCAPIRGALLHQKPSNGRVGMWMIKCAKKESLVLFKWLFYKNELPSLPRKREKAEYALKLFAHVS